MENEIISDIITVEADKMPPNTDFIEKAIRKHGFEPVRWAIVEADKNILTISLSGYRI